jgi:hypothetical protein
MQDRQLYEQILGIGAPWHVERVELRFTIGCNRPSAQAEVVKCEGFA